MTVQFLKQLSSRSKKRVDVKINDNRSTILSVRWEPDHTRVSLHRLFLQAPGNVMEELACYIGGAKKKVAPSVKAFIEESLHQIDYSHLLDSRKLSTQGEFYDLRKIYDAVNATYFGGSLALNITWFGKREKRNRSRVTFGLFQQNLKLVKINRLLDSPAIPYYMISYVVYHEMLHSLYPTSVSARGTYCIHSEAFKQREAEFEHFEQARKWISDHKMELFLD